MLKLIAARTAKAGPEVLWQLLQERPDGANISHNKNTARWEEHVHFVEHHPYRSWMLIQNSFGEFVGAIYLTDKNEIGIFILKAHQRKGYAREAIRMVTSLYPPLPAISGSRRGKFVANIAPGNDVSVALFKGLGAKHIQNTYEF